jgi:hypothetical protein
MSDQQFINEFRAAIQRRHKAAEVARIFGLTVFLAVLAFAGFVAVPLLAEALAQ